MHASVKFDNERDIAGMDWKSNTQFWNVLEGCTRLRTCDPTVGTTYNGRMETGKFTTKTLVWVVTH
jgi:hypothetical protein